MNLLGLTVDLALSAFKSSVNGASELKLGLIPNRLHAVSGNCDPVYVVASLEWETRSSKQAYSIKTT